jgi:predicted DCC family thiol-disulfide oxidoreductase YuxK
MTTGPGPYVLLYDGTCGLCRRLAKLVPHLHPRLPVKLVDAADARQRAAYPQISPLQAMRSVHLILPDGNYFRGYDAIIVLTALLPGLRFLVPLMNTRLARWLGWGLYEWVTRHRYQISNLLLLD